VNVTVPAANIAIHGSWNGDTGNGYDIALLHLPALNPCLVHPLPRGFKVGHHVDQGLRFDDADGYGKPLTYTTSPELRRLQMPADLATWNEAVLASLLKLAPETRVILYWC
jgi:hypothetical protein